jgi:hypothetical protein
MSLDFQFDEATHAYTVNGAVLPSVTQIINDLQMGPLYPPGPYRVRGTRVHQATALHDQGYEVEVGEAIRPYLDSYIGALQNFPFRWEAIEQRLYHPTLLYAGTVDRVGFLGDEPVIADIKTGETGRETGLQTAGYALLVNNSNPRCYSRFKIRLLADGKPGKVERYPDSFDIEGFCAALDLYKWKRRK